MLKGKKKILSIKDAVSGKTVFQNGEIKLFPEKQKLREFITTKPDLSYKKC